MKHVIIGSGAAGIAAARTIRATAPFDEVIVISSDKNIHSRCLLQHYISGDRTSEGLSFIDHDFFSRENIEWLKNQSIQQIDTTNKFVHLAMMTIPYDRLLIATGAQNMDFPLFKNKKYPNVFTLRHFSDAEAIRQHAQGAKHVVILGAGLIGMDVADALLKIGIKPTIIDLSSSILSANLDEYAAAVYQKKFEDAGCMFYLNESVTDFTTDAQEHINTLTLSAQTRLQCDMVVVAIGTTPSVDVLKDSGIAHNPYIHIDAYLKTNIIDVYAAGDVTGLSGTWPSAIKQGEVAARNMCGVPTPYTITFALKNTINYFGIPTLALGAIKECENVNVFVYKHQLQYEKVVIMNGVIVGVIVQGDISHSGFWQHLIENKIDVSALNLPALSVSFADFYSTKPNGEYQWML